jgi:FkbM family methyltransferase
VRLNPRRYIGTALSNAGTKILRRGGVKGVWIDVGAHLGETTLAPAMQNPDLTVYAFEPNLRAAVSLVGRAHNFIVLPMAVAETDGCAQFHINSLEEASSLLAMDENSRRSWKGGSALREESTQTVPTIRLDTFMDATGIARVDFLKVDTQGSDLAVLRSAGKRLRDIRKITLEVDVSLRRLYQDSPSKEEVLSFLQVAGFTLVSNALQSQGQEENLTFECSSYQ